MGLQSIFSAVGHALTSKSAKGVFCVAAGASIASIDILKLLHGDPTALSGQWLAAGTGMALAGIKLITHAEKTEQPTVIIIKDDQAYSPIPSNNAVEI